MFWQEEKNQSGRFAVPDDVVDVAFNIVCRSLPVDHAYALSQAIMQALPWFADEDRAGLHTIHVADSGNGWMRPDNPQDLLCLSRRTKLVLRLPQPRVSDAGKLTGQTLDVAGHVMQVQQAAVRPLSAMTTLFARYVVTGEDLAETGFMRAAAAHLEKIDIRPKKMLCGMENLIATPARSIRTRSLMLADLTIAESIKLQQHGLGEERKLGCGLFIAHKGIDEIKQLLD